jgi:hypothetical protein
LVAGVGPWSFLSFSNLEATGGIGSFACCHLVVRSQYILRQHEREKGPPMKMNMNMQTSTAICFVFSLLLCAVLLCTVAPAQDTMNHDDGQKTYASSKPIQLAGKISNTGETFVSDKDSKSWTIVNPDAIKGHEGQHVLLTANVDADKNEVNVVSLKLTKK